MKRFRYGWSLLFITTVLGAPVFAEEAVHTYTTEELNRKYGTVPGVSHPVDRTPLADWAVIQDFIDRQYARLDAERRYAMERQVADQQAQPQYRPEYSGVAAWGYYYPGSTSWGYSGRSSGRNWANYRDPRSVLDPPRMPRRPGIPDVYRRDADFPRGTNTMATTRGRVSHRK
jgi:hypothetical protein